MASDKFNRAWITSNAIPIVQKYRKSLTLRGLHYQLVALGMTNTMQHYKRVVSAMIKARWEGQLAFDDFVDHDREMIGRTDAAPTDLDDKVDHAKEQVELWMTSYRKNRWENQHYYPEVFIEKKALIGAFEDVCRKHDVALNPCKGYPSLTFLYEAKERFEEAEWRGQKPVILYFGDYDPSGEDIPRSIEDNLREMGVEVEVRRIALMEDQVVKWGLPPAPAKAGDSRTAKWEGLGQVELDAVSPEELYDLCEKAIENCFQEEKYDELLEQQEEEKKLFQAQLKNHVQDMEFEE